MQETQKKRLGTRLLSLVLCASLVLGAMGSFAFKAKTVAYADELTVAATDTGTKTKATKATKATKTKKKKQKINIKKARVQKVQNQTYTGKALKPALKVTYKGKTLRYGKDYKVTYKNNVMFDSVARAIIKGKGNYKGTRVVRFNIEAPKWNGPVLNRTIGVVNGPSGRETYYNLPMGGVVNIMRSKGYSAQEYPYWVRNDGCKMLGKFIMVAANLQWRPRGSIVQTSRGMGIVCDTGYLMYRHLDLAVNW